jgi:ribose transport system substrate-binding protein
MKNKMKGITMRHRLFYLSCLVLFSLFITLAQTGNVRSITIGLIGKSQSNPVFSAAYAGAKVAAKEIGTKNGVEVIIDWQTPLNENPQEQSDIIDKLTRSGAAGIAIACSDANIVTPSINKAVDVGIQVICFDSDAPKSKRFAYYGTDDVELGHLLMREIAREIGEKGAIAILAGNKNAPNLKQRVQAVLEELKKYQSVELVNNGIYYHEEIPEKAAEVMAQAQKANSKIKGWICVGGWPFFMKNAIHWEPGQIKIVSVDALPNQIEYLKSGHAQVLIAQGCFTWGYKSVELLIEKILMKKSPSQEFNTAPITRVTKENSEEWALNWRKWLLKEAVNR